MINDMGKDSISLVRNSRKKAFGRKTNESSGLMND